MDVRQLTRLIGIAAQGSLILLGSTAALAGHYSYEQPTRPHVSAADAPNWGFNQTCWSRFPPVPGCVRNGYDFIPEGDANQPSQQLLYAPQNALLRLDSQSVTPKYGNSQAPANVFPTTPPQTELEGMPAMPIPNVPSQSGAPPLQFGPSKPPSLPEGSFIPGVPPTLPPQPAPGLQAPGQSSLQMPNIMLGPNRQMIARSVSASTTPMPPSSRYGSVGRSVLPATKATQVSAVSFTNTVVAATSLSYRSGNAKPSVRGISGPQLRPAELPAIVIYPTISGRPLYRTP